MLTIFKLNVNIFIFVAEAFEVINILFSHKWMDIFHRKFVRLWRKSMDRFVKQCLHCRWSIQAQPKVCKSPFIGLHLPIIYRIIIGSNLAYTFNISWYDFHFSGLSMHESTRKVWSVPSIVWKIGQNCTKWSVLSVQWPLVVPHTTSGFPHCADHIPWNRFAGWTWHRCRNTWL